MCRKKKEEKRAQDRLFLEQSRVLLWWNASYVLTERNFMHFNRRHPCVQIEHLALLFGINGVEKVELVVCFS
jgi:hypothetical protein